VSKADDERKRRARMEAALVRINRKNNSRPAIDKRNAKADKLRRNLRGDD
jgi:hypothetical protein